MNVIISKSTPYTAVEIKSLSEQYEVFIKTVIDLTRRVCSAGSVMHYECEEVLLKDGSRQEDLWGGGIDLETKMITYNSFINIRPAMRNSSNEIQDEERRRKYEELTKYFFAEILDIKNGKKEDDK